MAKRRVLLTVLTTLNVLTASVAMAAWAPESDEWPGIRRDLAHTGEAPDTSLFTSGPGGFAKVKWARAGATEIERPVLYPMHVADVNRDGIPEGVVTSTDVVIKCIDPTNPCTPPAPDFSFSHAVEVLDGRTGATRPGWPQDEPNSFALVNGANILSLVGGNVGNIVYFRGNPLTGTSATNNLVARELNGAQKWQFSDPLVWGNSQHPIGVLVGAQSGSVAPDTPTDLPETVFGVSMVDFTITTPPNPACPVSQAFVCIDAQNVRSFLYALNGEGSSANVAWSIGPNLGGTSIGLLGSTPALYDLDGNGTLDTVFGTGVPRGTLINSEQVDLRTDASAEDNRVVAISGGGPGAPAAGSPLWTVSVVDPPLSANKRPMSATPVIAGTLEGDPVVAFLAPVPPQCGEPGTTTAACAIVEPEPNNRNILIAFNGRTGAERWRISNINNATIAPLGVANLDNVGEPEIIVQVDDRLQTYHNDGTPYWISSCPAPASPDPNHTWPQGSCVRYSRDLTSAGVAVADLDSDGTKDIAAILNGDHDDTDPRGDCNPQCAELLVVDGTNGAVEWTNAFAGDESTGGPVIADLDGDDDFLEIALTFGTFTAVDSEAHTGGVVVLEPNAPDIDPVVTCGPPTCSRVNDETQAVHVAIHNAGTREVPIGTVVRLLDNGSTVADQALLSPLAAGASRTLDYEWTPSSSGTHILKGSADPGNLVRELVETNNDGQTTLVTGYRPIASFTFSPASPTELETLTFTDTSTADGTVTPPATIASRSWSCSDGFTSTAASPTHRFTEGGPYSCSLTVTDSRGLTSDPSATNPITVSHVSPLANFSSSVVSPGNVQFTDSSTHPNSPQDAPPTGWSYLWEFGDGDTSTVRNPSHDYGVTSGLFDVHLTVTDNDGQTDDITKTIDVASTVITRTGPWDDRIISVSQRPDLLGFGTAVAGAGANLETGEITATATVTQTTLPTGVILDGLPPIGASIATGSGSLRALVNVPEAGPHRVTVTMQIDSAGALGGAVFPLGSASSSASATAAAALATCTGPVCMVLPATQVSAQQALACRPGTCTHGPTVTFTMILNVPAPGTVAIDGGLVASASIRGAGEASAVASAHLLSVTIGPA